MTTGGPPTIDRERFAADLEAMNRTRWTDQGMQRTAFSAAHADARAWFLQRGRDTGPPRARRRRRQPFGHAGLRAPVLERLERRARPGGGRARLPLGPELSALSDALIAFAHEQAARWGLDVRVTPAGLWPSAHTHERARAAVARGAAALGLSALEMPSGAGHDAQVLARITTTGMGSALRGIGRLAEHLAKRGQRLGAVVH